VSRAAGKRAQDWRADITIPDQDAADVEQPSNLRAR
jgi:hypothetical protein